MLPLWYTERTVERDTQVLTCCGKRTRPSTPSIKMVSSAPIPPLPEVASSGWVCFHVPPLQLWRIMYFISQILRGFRKMPKRTAATCPKLWEMCKLPALKRRASNCRVFYFCPSAVSNLRKRIVNVSQSCRNCWISDELSDAPDLLVALAN